VLAGRVALHELAGGAGRSKVSCFGSELERDLAKGASVPWVKERRRARRPRRFAAGSRRANPTFGRGCEWGAPWLV